MTDETGGQAPTDGEVRIIMFQAMEQMFLHSQASTELLKTIDARLAGVAAGSDAIAGVVDDNETQLANERTVAMQKELINHIFDKSHQYVTIIIAGAFAAYFTTLGALTTKFKDIELRVSALLMTVSVTVFVMWEILNMFYIGHHTFKGDFGVITQQTPWLRRGWYIAMVATLGTAIPAIGLSLFVYLRGLGVGAMLTKLLG
ncbi:hypothetical protein [Sphingomonas sp. Leaf242]|uniref:hypothetical protein n=1 Tax=Sphingomonas sp. Leaf242 TaxID=1736304 RepID=UPI0007160197|nr:hypothetical protein [Sphingomonas sp. Leaf242]KQO06915.1 hypothetical protein ASF09_11685 [Sphingomonas sp. Leaf242]